MLGQAEAQSHTQKWTCHKLNLFGVGQATEQPIKFDQIQHLAVSESPATKEMQMNVKFYHELLHFGEDE